MMEQPNRERSRDAWGIAADDPAAVVADPAVFESADVAIHVVNAQGRIVEVNRAFELLYGASRRLYLGKHAAILGTAPLAAGLRLLDGIRGGVRSQGAWRGTLESERFNGAGIRSRTHVYPMRVEGGDYLVFFQEEARPAARAHPPAAARARQPARAVGV